MLQCILDDSGGNTLVERKCGKLFRDATVQEDPIDRDENNDNESYSESSRQHRKYK